jgi:hypothetical protein
MRESLRSGHTHFLRSPPYPVRRPGPGEWTRQPEERLIRGFGVTRPLSEALISRYQQPWAHQLARELSSQILGQRRPERRMRDDTFGKHS